VGLIDKRLDVSSLLSISGTPCLTMWVGEGCRCKRNPDGQGFAAFGRVVKGMDVVKKIQASSAEGQTLKPPVKIVKMTRKPSQ
jgi:cyclophilin family peptidyl-prolyl cis-trans isomerase